MLPAQDSQKGALPLTPWRLQWHCPKLRSWSWTPDVSCALALGPPNHRVLFGKNFAGIPFYLSKSDSASDPQVKPIYGSNSANDGVTLSHGEYLASSGRTSPKKAEDPEEVNEVSVYKGRRKSLNGLWP